MRPILIALISAALGAIAALVVHGMISNRGHAVGVTQQRVLAEAVSSYPDTGQFFVVADTVRPFTPLGYYQTRAAADSAATRSGPYRAYGPYTGTSRDPWRVLAVTLRVRTDSGERDIRYDPRAVDAVFLTMNAFKKFMVPYYRRLYGDVVADSVVFVIVPPPPRPPTPPCHAMSVPCTSMGTIPLPGAH